MEEKIPENPEPKQTWKDFLKQIFDEQMRIVVKTLITAKYIMWVGGAWIALSLSISLINLFTDNCSKPKIEGANFLFLKTRLLCPMDSKYLD